MRGRDRGECRETCLRDDDGDGDAEEEVGDLLTDREGGIVAFGAAEEAKLTD